MKVSNNFAAFHPEGLGNRRTPWPPQRSVTHDSGRDIPGFGGLGGTRTPDALLRTEALYPLSYEAAAISQRERAERYPNFRCRVLCPTPSPLSSRPQSSGRSRKSSSGNRARSPNRSTG